MCVCVCVCVFQCRATSVLSFYALTLLRSSSSTAQSPIRPTQRPLCQPLLAVLRFGRRTQKTRRLTLFHAAVRIARSLTALCTVCQSVTCKTIHCSSPSQHFAAPQLNSGLILNEISFHEHHDRAHRECDTNKRSKKLGTFHWHGLQDPPSLETLHSDDEARLQFCSFVCILRSFSWGKLAACIVKKNPAV